MCDFMIFAYKIERIVFFPVGIMENLHESLNDNTSGLEFSSMLVSELWVCVLVFVQVSRGGVGGAEGLPEEFRERGDEGLESSCAPAG